MGSLRGREVLVTGATGFIGRGLCAALGAAGARVHALSRSGAAPSGSHASHAVDACDARALAGVVRAVRPSHVYHLAAHVTGSREVDAVLPTLHGKLVSTVNLLAACHELASCRVVLAGSLEEPQLTQGRDDEAPVPSSPYAAATWAASAYGRMFHALYGRAVVTARIFMAYGPGDPNTSRLVPWVTRKLLAGEAPALGSGQRPVDWVYIDDLVAGLVALGANESIVDGSVDLGSGELVSVREVARMIQRLIGTDVAPAFGALPERKGETIRAADLAATKQSLGWSPTTSLQQGLKNTVDYYRANPG